MAVPSDDYTYDRQNMIEAVEDDDGESNTPRVPYQGRFA